MKFGEWCIVKVKWCLSVCIHHSFGSRAASSASDVNISYSIFVGDGTKDNP